MREYAILPLDAPQPALFGRGLIVGSTFRGNFYRCDESIHHHFGGWNPIESPRPDFHRSERFGMLKLAEDK